MKRSCARATWQINSYMACSKKSILIWRKKSTRAVACTVRAICIAPNTNANPVADPKEASRFIAVAFAVTRMDAANGTRHPRCVFWVDGFTGASSWFWFQRSNRGSDPNARGFCVRV